MKKAISTLCLAFPLITVAVESTDSQKLKEIDGQIQKLRSELSEYRKKAFNEEMQAQPQMIDNWHQFVENIRLSEEDEKHVQSIKEEIQKLEAKKQKVIKNPTK